jgi:predicted O-methyltransferase YrrM
MSILRSLWHKREPEYGWEPGPVNPRYGYSRPPHPELLQRIASGRDLYRRWLTAAEQRFAEDLAAIPMDGPPGGLAWKNDFLAPLDLALLYAIVRESAPANYLEIGSGISTLVARKAIEDGALPTKVTAVDPRPRVEIEKACDSLIRAPFDRAEDLPTLGRGDIVFLDGGHRVGTASDVTVFFLEMLPRLAPGVLVHVHDVYLPNDYPPELLARNYSEQYMLAAVLLAAGSKYLIEFPAFYVTHGGLVDLGVEPWRRLAAAGLAMHGESFWFRVQ